MTQWEIFYTPHTDDESIGMAGSICRARDAGHRVLVVLVTDNVPSTRGLRLFPDQNASDERRKEWTRAMTVLGVTDLVCWEIPEAAMLSHAHMMQNVVMDRMHMLEQQYLVACHHTVWGADDVHVDASAPTVSHLVCANALIELQRLLPRMRARLHGVYLYSEQLTQRTAPLVLHLDAETMLRKMEALDCYRLSTHSIGYGYTSVPELIDAASIDPREFLQEIPYDTRRTD
jgi:LmbE family N-acetylglucosaminyl deacetylase